MDLYHYPDHVRAAVLRMLAAERPKEKLSKLVSNEAHRIQLLEDQVWNWWEQLDLETAPGVFLERIGDIVGEARQGREDEIYRLWIRARAKANRSAGSVPDMLEILELILPAGTVVEYVDLPYEIRDAEAYFIIYGNVPYPDQVRAILESVVGAGIQLDVTFITTDPAGTFSFEGGPGLGFNEGAFAGIL